MKAGYEVETTSIKQHCNCIIVANYTRINYVINYPTILDKFTPRYGHIGVWKIKQLKNNYKRRVYRNHK
jgi:hypothetical protein